ncbi:unnamed protein product [Rodentolepis nana]|uniref:Ig-like domain-containing protein n=1 Tax=Rodentolepis nana TaxID=102285 RepID=A0A0R3TZA1_RODNA|nr:unnamed protein product [Rodentolepis nana]
MLMYLLLFIQYMITSHADRITLNALPSVFPKNGSKLHLICQLHEKNRFNIMWKRDGKNVGENCIAYKTINAARQNCYSNETVIEWIIDPVVYDIRGRWSCSHGKDIASIDIEVNVPQKLHPLKIESLQNRNQPASDAILSPVSIEEYPLAAGTQSHPFDLTKSQPYGVRSIVFECSSFCASETRQLVWTSFNGTMFRKYPLKRTSYEEGANCPGDLTSARSRALITCRYGNQQSSKWETESPVSVDLKLSLVGLNIVYCSTDQPARISNNGDYACTNGFLNDSSNTACAYVLCDGK